MTAVRWYLRPPAQRLTPQDLPAATPLLTRLVHAAYGAFTGDVQADIRKGHNSERVSRAFEQLDATAIAPLRLSRRERARGIAGVAKLHSEGVAF